MSDQFLSTFSHPFQGDFVGSSSRLARRSFFAALHYLSVGDEKLRPLGEMLREADTLSEGASDYWRSELGLARLLLQNYPGCTGSITAEMMSAAYLTGLIPQISIETNLERPIAIAGQIVRAPNILMMGSEGRLDVLDADGAPLVRLQQHSADGALPVWALSDRSNVVSFGTATACSIVDGKSIDAIVGEHSNDQVDSLPRGFGDNVQAAADLLESFAPHYYVWTAQSAKEIAALQDRNVCAGAPISRSYLFCPTQIQVTANASLLQMVDLIVHECSHQYFQLVALNFPIVSKGAPEVYSALKRKNRPFQMVLLGYHACGNITLAFNELIENGIGSDVEEIHRQIGLLRPTLQSLGDMVEANVDRHLEPAGKNLYLPLRDLLLKKNMVTINPD